MGLKQVGSNSTWGDDLRNPWEINGKPPDRATIWAAEQNIVKSFWQVRTAAECWGASRPFRALATATFFFFMNVSAWTGHCFTVIDINEPLFLHQAAAVYKPSLLLIEGPLVMVRLMKSQKASRDHKKNTNTQNIKGNYRVQLGGKKNPTKATGAVVTHRLAAQRNGKESEMTADSGNERRKFTKERVIQRNRRFFKAAELMVMMKPRCEAPPPHSQRDVCHIYRWQASKRAWWRL